MNARCKTVLTKHVRTYVLAEYYDLPDLKDMAFDKFRKVKYPAPGGLKDTDFFSLTAEICGSTTDNDGRLRQLMARHAAHNYQKRSKAGKEALIERAKRCSDFFPDFMRATTARYEKASAASDMKHKVDPACVKGLLA